MLRYMIELKYKKDGNWVKYEKDGAENPVTLTEVNNWKYANILRGGVSMYVCMACGYESQLKDAETKAQAEEIANKLKICLKDMEIKRLEEEIKKLKKRKKSK